MTRTEVEELLMLSKLSNIPVLFTLITTRGIQREYELSMHDNTLHYWSTGYLMDSAYECNEIVKYILTSEHSFGTKDIHAITGVRLAG